MARLGDTLERLRLRRLPRLRGPLAWLFPIAATGLMLVVQLGLQPEIELAPFILFFLSVFLSSWLCGLGPGFLAIALAAALSNYFFIVPALSFSARSLVLTGLFIVVSATINLLSASLRRAEIELEGAVRARDDFLAIAGHEFKSPLTALDLQLGQILRVLHRDAGEVAPEDLVARVERSLAHVRRIERLVHEMLDVSRITAGGLQLRPEPVDLTALVQETLDRLGETARRSGSQLDLHHPGPIPGEWDRARIDQLVTGLVANALKYGMGKPVEVELLADDSTAMLRVRDHGIGIDPSDQRRIFGRFERAVSERHFGGLGLGLWVAHKVVEAGGGRIEVQSVPGQGATFTVRLPRHPPPIR